MANEITVSGRLNIKDGFLNSGVPSKSFKVSQSRIYDVGGTIAVSSTPEELPILDIDTVGYVWLRNVSDTTESDYYISAGLYISGTYYPIMKMYAGEFAMFPSATNSIYVATYGEDQELEFLLCDR